MSVTLKHLFKRGAALAAVLLLVLSVAASASASTFIPYTTYTYDFDGLDLKSPHAYVADKCYLPLDMKLSTPFSSPNDLFIDSTGKVYVADTGNNRIVVFDADMKFLGELTQFYNKGAIIPYVKDLLYAETGDPDAVEPEETEDTGTVDLENIGSGGKKALTVAKANEELQKKLERRLKRYAEPDEDGVEPQVFTLTLEEYFTVEKKLAQVEEDLQEEEYEKITAELKAAGNAAPPSFEAMMDFINYMTVHDSY